MTITIEVTKEMEHKLRGLTMKAADTVEEKAHRLFTKAVEDACYRVRRNAIQYAQKKELQARTEAILKRAQELGLDLGLAEEEELEAA